MLAVDDEDTREGTLQDALASEESLLDDVGSEKGSDRYPLAMRFIMVNEIFERFSFYGMKAILALYLQEFLKFDEDTAVAAIHVFIFGAYASALLGGFISDSYLGKFRTIFWGSVVYCIGSALMSVTAIPGVVGTPPHWWGAVLSLFLIALGTGGIKACVSVFVGDQFRKGQEHLLEGVYAVFYFCINVGSLMSTLITPLLREYVSFWVAFGVPAVLLVAATIVFVVGKPTYRCVPPGPNVFKVVFGVVREGFRQRKLARASGMERDIHVVDYAKEVYPDETVNDVRAVLGVFRVFVALPVFWALFDQHASRWVFQAKQMDRSLPFGAWNEIQADQIPALNPILLLTFIPIFNKVVYPFFRARGLALTPLKGRMAPGMVLIASAFVIAGFVQLAIGEVDVPDSSSSLSTSLSSSSSSSESAATVYWAWQIPQYLLLVWGEIMVSITGLEFAYSQAPKSMKGVVMAAFLLTIAVGNAFVAAIAESRIFGNQAVEYFFYGGLMILFAVIFLAMIWRYQYVDPFNRTLEGEEPVDMDCTSDSTSSLPAVTPSGGYTHMEDDEPDY